MTEPTDDELDEVVAMAAGWIKNHLGIHSWIAKIDDSWMYDSIEHPASDFNALMAAVAKLEETTEYGFPRDADSGNWILDKNDKPIISFDIDVKSEARALALCIHAVVNQ